MDPILPTTRTLAFRCYCVCRMLFNAVFKFISEIRIRRFVGVLRARLHSLSADSEPSVIILAVQNLQSVWQVIRDRTEEGSQLPGFLTYILDRFVTEKLIAEAPSGRRGPMFKWL